MGAPRMYHVGSMASRLISWRGAAGLAGALQVLAACGNGAQRAPSAEDPHALVVPPLVADAGAPASPEPSSEPARLGRTLALRARDPRLAKRQPRSRAHVLGEVQHLERLLATTPSSSPDRPTLRYRLAEAYNELAYTSSGPDADRARDRAIEQYVQIRAEHPQYSRLDEVTYYLALAYELNGDRTDARRVYFELIAKHPSSRLVPLAYFAFGELFSSEAQHEPSKNVQALDAYIEASKYAPPDNPIYADALLRIGETQLRMHERARAKETFDRLQRELPDSDAAAKIPPVP